MRHSPRKLALLLLATSLPTIAAAQASGVRPPADLAIQAGVSAFSQVFLIVAIGVYLLLKVVGRSPYGLALRAGRDNPMKIEALGVAPYDERGKVTDEFVAAFRELWTKPRPEMTRALRAQRSSCSWPERSGTAASIARAAERRLASFD